MNPSEIVLLGSTGSIGTQAIDVVARNPDRFRVTGLSAGGRDAALVARQAAALGVEAVALADPAAEAAFRGAWTGGPVEVLTGPDASTELAGRGADVVLNGITGSVGLGAYCLILVRGNEDDRQLRPRGKQAMT